MASTTLIAVPLVSASPSIEGTKNLVHAGQKVGVKRFVYTAGNSVVLGGKAISGGDETLP